MAYGGPILESGVHAVVLKAIGAQLGEPAHEKLTIKKSKYEAEFVCFHPGLRINRIQEKLYFLNQKKCKNDVVL